VVSLKALLKKGFNWGGGKSSFGGIPTGAPTPLMGEPYPAIYPPEKILPFLKRFRPP